MSQTVGKSLALYPSDLFGGIDNLQTYAQAVSISVSSFNRFKRANKTEVDKLIHISEYFDALVTRFMVELDNLRPTYRILYGVF